MIVVFTGTQCGMSIKQLHDVLQFLHAHRPVLLLHGDCIGADAEAHTLAKLVGIPVEIYPTNIEGKRAYCQSAVKVHEVMPPLERNKVMVDRADYVYAAPRTSMEENRSGTWATIRYAKASGKPVGLFV